MKCKYCKELKTLKKGKRNSIQRYYCKECKIHFQESYTYKAYEGTTDTLLISLLKESCSVLGMARVLKISKNTVLSRMLKISKQIKIPHFNMLGCKFEVDEMWSFIGNKKNVTWITYAIEQKTGQVIDFFVGRKTKDTIRPVINKVLLLQPTRIYTDRLNIYPSLIPKEIRFTGVFNIVLIKLSV